MRGRVDQMTVDEAVRHFYRFGSPRAKDFILDAQTRPKVNGVLHFIGVDRELKDHIKSVGEKLEVPELVFEVQHGKRSWDIYLQVGDENRQSVTAILAVLAEHGIRPTSRTRQHYTPGILRILDAEQTIEQLTRLHKLTGTLERFETVQLPYFQDATRRASEEGYLACCMLYHHVDKSQVEKIRQLCTTNTTVIAGKIQQIGGAPSNEQIVNPQVFPEQPGFYDVYVPWGVQVSGNDFPADLSTGEVGENEIAVIRTLAEVVGVRIWHKLSEEARNGSNNPAPINIKGYLRIFNREQAAAEFRRCAEYAADSKPEMRQHWMNCIDKALSSSEHWKLLLFHGVDKDQVDRLLRVDNKAPIVELENGRYQVYLSGTLQAKIEEMRVIARSFGLALYEEIYDPDKAEGDRIAVRMFPPGKVSPEMAIEARDALAKITRNYYSELVDLATYYACPREEAEILMIRMPQMLEKTDCVIWKTDMWEAAVSGCESFNDTTLDKEFIGSTLPQMWIMEDMNVPFLSGLPAVDWELPRPYDDSSRLNLMAFCVIPVAQVHQNTTKMQAIEALARNASSRHETGKRGIMVGVIFNPICATDSTNSVIVPTRDGLPVFRMLPPIYPDEPICNSAAPLVAALKFMRLEIVSKESLNPPRAFRRRAEREGRKLPSVHTIYLRRTRPAKAKEETEPGTEAEHKREFHYQFMVGWPKGFWRKQWYPSVGEHKPVYIAPYLKGDSSLPFKPPQKRIYKVAR